MEESSHLTQNVTMGAVGVLAFDKFLVLDIFSPW